MQKWERGRDYRGKLVSDDIQNKPTGSPSLTNRHLFFYFVSTPFNKYKIQTSFIFINDNDRKKSIKYYLIQNRNRNNWSGEAMRSAGSVSNISSRETTLIPHDVLLNYTEIYSYNMQAADWLNRQVMARFPGFQLRFFFTVHEHLPATHSVHCLVHLYCWLLVFFTGKKKNTHTLSLAHIHTHLSSAFLTVSSENCSSCGCTSKRSPVDGTQLKQPYQHLKSSWISRVPLNDCVIFYSCTTCPVELLWKTEQQENSSRHWRQEAEGSRWVKSGWSSP